MMIWMGWRDGRKNQFFLLVILSVIFLLSMASGPSLAATWQADLTIRVLSPKIPLIQSQAKFYQKGQKIRVVSVGSNEINLYHFERAVVIRIFPADRIYFEKPLSLARTIKAMKEGWIAPPPPFEVRKILLRKGSFQGKKSALFLIVFARKDQKAYALRWETDDAAALPLRVIYPGSGRETIILDYVPMKNQEIPPDYFDPPADYLNLNPF